jgi:hypothetical protein
MTDDAGVRALVLTGEGGGFSAWSARSRSSDLRAPAACSDGRIYLYFYHEESHASQYQER